MLELLFCSMLTILPDFLYRRFAQGKRLGREITFFTVWYELRYGIVGCVVLTVTLITLVFFFHPASTRVTSYFRTVPVLPEGSGRVEEVFVGLREEVKAGQPLFTLDSRSQRAAIETAKRRVAEVDAEMVLAQSDLALAQGNLDAALGAYNQAKEEYDTRAELRNRNPDAISARDVERLMITVDARQGAVDAARAAMDNARAHIEVQLPAARARAEAELDEAETALSKMTVYASVDGQLEQFSLRPGDVVNPLMRPAGILIPSEAGRVGLQAGFGQLESQVIHKGMIGEVTCPAIALTIVPVVVTDIQSVIATGQVRPTDQLLDLSQNNPSGTMTVYLEPLYPGGLDRLLPGSNCIANLYSSYHEELQNPDLSTLQTVAYHGIDAIGFVHGLILRMQAVALPVKTLVLGGH
jgi:multidrug resistance efflux pump